MPNWPKRCAQGTFEPQLACPGPGPLLIQLQARDFKTVLFPAIPALEKASCFRLMAIAWALIRSNLLLYRHLRAHSYVLVHVNGLRALPGAAFATLLARRHLVVHLRDLPRRRRLLHLASRMAFALISPSSYLAPRLPRSVRATVIPTAPNSQCPVHRTWLAYVRSLPWRRSTSW